MEKFSISMEDVSIRKSQRFGHLVGMNLDSFELFFQKNIE